MDATPGNKKSSRNQKGRIPTTKLREQQPCQIPAYPSTSLRKQRQSKPLSTRPSSPHPTMTSHSSIKEGKRKEVTSKQKRPVTSMAKDYHLPKTSHHLQKSEAKGRGSRFFHIACMTSYLSVRKQPTPIATLQTSPKNIDIKNQPSGKHLRYLFIRHNLSVMPDGYALRKQPN